MLNGSSPQLKTLYGVLFAEAAAANRVRSLDASVSSLRFTQLRGIYSLEDVSNKDHSPERGRRTEREVGRGELQVNFKKQAYFRTELPGGKPSVQDVPGEVFIP